MAERGDLIQPTKLWFLFDIVLNQYLLSLGEFSDLDGYEAHDQNILCWVLSCPRILDIYVSLLQNRLYRSKESMKMSIRRQL